jgi:hypothetical protein
VVLAVKLVCLTRPGFVLLVAASPEWLELLRFETMA